MAIAVSTYLSHSDRCFDFYKKYLNRDPKINGLILFAIGRSTPWPDETNPPLPELSETELQECFGYKVPSEIFFVVPNVEEGTISVDNVRWSKVTPIDEIDGVEARSIFGPDATAQQILYCAVRRLRCRWLLVSTIIRSTDFPTSGATSYRQIGLFSNVILKDTTVLAETYLEEDIKDKGVLTVQKSREPIYRSIGQSDSILFVIEF